MRGRKKKTEGRRERERERNRDRGRERGRESEQERMCMHELMQALNQQTAILPLNPLC